MTKGHNMQAFIDLIEQIEGEVDLHDTFYAARETQYIIEFISEDILASCPDEFASLVKAYQSFYETDDILTFAISLREIKAAVAAK